MFGDGVAEEDGVGYAYETVVDGVGVDEGDVAFGEIGENCVLWVGCGERLAESGVETAISIWRGGDLGRCGEDDLAIKREAW